MGAEEVQGLWGWEKVGVPFITIVISVCSFVVAYKTLKSPVLSNVEKSLVSAGVHFGNVYTVLCQICLNCSAAITTGFEGVYLIHLEIGRALIENLADIADAIRDVGHPINHLATAIGALRSVQPPPPQPQDFQPYLDIAIDLVAEVGRLRREMGQLQALQGEVVELRREVERTRCRCGERRAPAVAAVPAGSPVPPIRTVLTVRVHQPAPRVEPSSRRPVASSRSSGSGSGSDPDPGPGSAWRLLVIEGNEGKRWEPVLRETNHRFSLAGPSIGLTGQTLHPPKRTLHCTRSMCINRWVRQSSNKTDSKDQTITRSPSFETCVKPDVNCSSYQARDSTQLAGLD
ncbi:hypothetical protein V8F06_011709 [Rhypophila decipiens]